MDNYVAFDISDKQFFMKSSKVNYHSTNTALASMCSLASQEVKPEEKKILHNQSNDDDCEFIEGGYLEDEDEKQQPNKLYAGLDQNGINYEEESNSDLCKHKNERCLTDFLDFSFLLPKHVDTSLENLVNNIENKPHFLHYNLPDEEPFQQMSDYECKIKQECSYSIQKKELIIQKVSNKIKQFQIIQVLSDSEDNVFNGSRKIKKNVNMPKAIARYLMKNYKNYEKSVFAEYKELFAQLDKDVKQFKNWKRKDKNNCFKLNHLSFFFSDRNRKKLSCLNRLMMRKILSKNTRKEIVPSNQVKDKLEYLVASKVYSIRCANHRLATRMQMR